jgi:hypothetical protein
MGHLIHFQKSKCVCIALRVKKITGGTAPGLGSLKAPDGIETAALHCIYKAILSVRERQSFLSISVEVS